VVRLASHEPMLAKYSGVTTRVVDVRMLDTRR
jgi:hypothetical protein